MIMTIMIEMVKTLISQIIMVLVIAMIMALIIGSIMIIVSEIRQHKKVLGERSAPRKKLCILAPNGIFDTN